MATESTTEYIRKTARFRLETLSAFDVGNRLLQCTERLTDEIKKITDWSKLEDIYAAFKIFTDTFKWVLGVEALQRDSQLNSLGFLAIYAIDALLRVRTKVGAGMAERALAVHVKWVVGMLVAALVNCGLPLYWESARKEGGREGEHTAVLLEHQRVIQELWKNRKTVPVTKATEIAIGEHMSRVAALEMYRLTQVNLLVEPTEAEELNAFVKAVTTVGGKGGLKTRDSSKTVCCVCGKRARGSCGGCGEYTYCEEKCARTHWKDLKHYKLCRHYKDIV